MDLDQTLKLTQITFYIVVGLIAVFTYRSARRGLLNTVNTEYQKRVMDRIRQVADDLLAEFDPDSSQYWLKQTKLNQYLKPIQETFAKHRDQILAERKFSPGIPNTAELKRLKRFGLHIRSDPFLPAIVRDIVADFLTARHSVLLRVYLDEMRQYAQELAEGEHGQDFSHDAGMVHNRINAALYERGCGVSQNETDVHDIRLKLQKYMESFNPFPK